MRGCSRGSDGPKPPGRWRAADPRLLATAFDPLGEPAREGMVEDPLLDPRQSYLGSPPAAPPPMPAPDSAPSAPPLNQTPARPAPPRDPSSSPGSAARYRLRGRWSRSPRPSQSHWPRLRGSPLLPRPLLGSGPGPAGAPARLPAATAEPEEVRRESGPARGGATGKGAAGRSGAERWGRLGRGPGEGTLTRLLPSLARLTVINCGGW